MDDRDIEGSFTLLPPRGFFTRAKAADLLARQLHPVDRRRRTEAASRLDSVIYDALCSGELIGRDPDLRLPIERRDLAGAMMLCGCIISEGDFNDWLERRAVGISIDADLIRDISPAVEQSPAETIASTTRKSSIPPSPERDEAMLRCHETYSESGSPDYLARVVRKFGVSRTTVVQALKRARAARLSTPISSADAWRNELAKVIDKKAQRR